MVKWMSIFVLATVSFIAGYNVSGQPDLVTNLEILRAVQGNDFGLDKWMVRSGSARVIVDTAQYSTLVSFYVPRELSRVRLERWRDDERISSEPMTSALNTITGVRVDEVYSGEIRVQFDPQFQKADLICKCVQRIFEILRK